MSFTPNFVSVIRGLHSRNIYFKQISLCFIFTLYLSQSLFSQINASTSTGRRVLLYPNGTWKYAEANKLENIVPATIAELEIPAIKSRSEVIRHSGYSLSYNEKHEQANWIAYELTAAETKAKFSRTDNFQPDPLVLSGTATQKDYKSSGYDRGHLAPAADMGWSEQSMEESFYFSNMSPQLPGFNRGVWKRLEEQVREWAIENEAVYVVTGPVLRKGLPTIGSEHISVPQYFYKVLLDYRLPEIKAIGFVIPNESSSSPLYTYSVSIDSVESLTGLDFFPQLPDDEENLIESSSNFKQWVWKASKEQNFKASSLDPDKKDGVIKIKPSGNSKPTNTVQPSQCRAMTKANIRCKRLSANASGFCWQHGG